MPKQICNDEIDELIFKIYCQEINGKFNFADRWIQEVASLLYSFKNWSCFISLYEFKLANARLNYDLDDEMFFCHKLALVHLVIATIYRERPDANNPEKMFEHYRYASDFFKQKGDSFRASKIDKKLASVNKQSYF